MPIALIGVGTKSTYRYVSRVCVECGSVIHESGLCSYECPLDGSDPRPRGSVIERVFKRTDEVLEEKTV